LIDRCHLRILPDGTAKSGEIFIRFVCSTDNLRMRFFVLFSLFSKCPVVIGLFKPLVLKPNPQPCYVPNPKSSPPQPQVVQAATAPLLLLVSRRATCLSKPAPSSLPQVSFFWSEQCNVIRTLSSLNSMFKKYFLFFIIFCNFYLIIFYTRRPLNPTSIFNYHYFILFYIPIIFYSQSKL
jgi:hypothetical protein